MIPRQTHTARNRTAWFTGVFLALLALALRPEVLQAQPNQASLDALQEQAIKAAIKKIAPSVVKIETSGGTDVIKAGPKAKLLQRGTGPTTGLVVQEDGYIITSAFNFANKPSTIRVTIQGVKERLVARVIATDQTRMLTLLKVDLPAGTKLVVPTAVPRNEMIIGFTALAIGRTFATDGEEQPSVSVGILSALDRIWGKAIQTDAKVSPFNYGGPLIDLYGRVFGVLVPASPTAEGETAGFEWYDSGIGFAVPLVDINSVLKRLSEGTEKAPVVLRAGFLGINPQSADLYAPPTIGSVAPGSSAEKAGLQVGDLFKEIDGQAVNNFAQVQHRIRSRYEGDTVTVKVSRAGADTVLKVVLGSAVAAFGQPFLGILPVRDDPEAGVEIRFVYPKSPADVVGLKEGDRIMKVGASPPVIKGKKGPPIPPPVGLIPITGGREQLITILDTARPDQEVSVEVKRKAGGKTETLKVKLADITSAEVPAKLPERSTAKKALFKPGPMPKAPEGKIDDKAGEKGQLHKRTTPAADHTYWVYVPANYDPQIACSVVVWLHPTGKNKERDIESFVKSWELDCDENNFLLVCPTTENPRGWTPAEAEVIQRVLTTVMGSYTVDRRRVVIHGMGVGGEMAYYLGFQVRNVVRGVATVGAPMTSNPRERIPNQPLSFFLVAGGKDPAKAAIQESRDRLAQFKYSTFFREVEAIGHEYIDGRPGLPTLAELIRWIDSLDRI